MIPVRDLMNTVLVVTPEYEEGKTFPVVMNSEFGTYEASIKIDEKAKSGSYSIQSMAEKANGKSFTGSTETFVVEDFKPPLFLLNVEAPSWSTPTGQIEISASLKNSFGFLLGGSEIDVQWQILDPVIDQVDELTGELTITTNEKGEGSTIFNLAKLNTPPSLESTISFDFSYKGPDNEERINYASTTIKAADLILKIERTVNTSFPDQTFGVSVVVTDLNGRPLMGDAVIETATIFLIQPASDQESTISNALTIATCVYVFGESSLNIIFR